MIERAHPSERGYSLVEVLVALAISVIGVEVLVTFQSNIAGYAVRLRQKVDVLDFEQDLIRTMFDADSCTCLTRGVAIAVDPTATAGGTRYAGDLSTIATQSVGTPRYNSDYSLNCGPSGRVLATAGQPLPASRTGVSVTRLRIMDLVRSNDPALVGEEYIGKFEAAFSTATGQQLNPARASGRFYVKDGKVVGCGPAPNSISFGNVGSLTMNDRKGYGESVATCPAGTVLIGGGWSSYYPPAPPSYPDDPVRDATDGCMTPNTAYPKNASAYYARHIRASADSSGFHVVAQCHAFAAIAMCYKPNIIR